MKDSHCDREIAVFRMMAFLNIRSAEVPTYSLPWPPEVINKFDVSPQGGHFTIWSDNRSMNYHGMVRVWRNSGRESHYEKRYIPHLPLHPELVGRLYYPLRSKCKDLIRSQTQETVMPFAQELIIKFFHLQNYITVNDVRSELNYCL